MRILAARETPTIELIKADLGDNPPGTSYLEIHLEFSQNAPVYIAFLLDRLRRTEKRLRHHTRKRRK